ncbi:hypothetical protein QUF80_06500 [Desulfococcaceae bacterium HSG8]|nr:hypothetical protein [Desulfococcaceae bacterium HSG8]
MSKNMDWRYYLVKYPAMREGASGRYAISPSGYSVCMRGYYRDPYLLAVWRTSDLDDDVFADIVQYKINKSPFSLNE